MSRITSCWLATTTDINQMLQNGYTSEATLRAVHVENVLNTIYLVNARVICYLVGFFGIATNIINIIIFTRQGFSDVVNVSLMGLAVADLSGIVCLLWSLFYDHPLLVKFVQLPYEPVGLMYVTSGVLQIYFSTMTCWITIFISLQRCLCVALPLKVKRLLTKNTTILILLFLYIGIFMIASSPIYLTGMGSLAWKFYPNQNRTLLGLAVGENFNTHFTIISIIHNTFKCSSFLILTASTFVLVIQLKRNTKWRKAVLAPGTGNIYSASSKEHKLADMIILLSVIQIVCFAPMTVFVCLGVVFPELAFIGKHAKILFTMWSFTSVLELINSSVSIFPYYAMSSKFRSSFLRLFSKNRRETKMKR